MKLNLVTTLSILLLAGCWIFKPEPEKLLPHHHAAMIEQAIDKPAAGQSFVDPVTGVSALRLTDAKAEGAQGYVSYYSKLNPFNADETLILVYRRGGTWHLFDIGGKYLRPLPIRNSQTDPQPRWHPLFAHKLLWFDANKIISHDLNTGANKIEAQFSEYTFITNYDEGNFDRNGYTLLLAGRDWPEGIHKIVRDSAIPGYAANDLKTFQDWRQGFGEMFIYSLVTGHVESPKIEITGQLVDWLSISPSGLYGVFAMAEGHGSDRWEGIDVYFTDGLQYRELPYYPYTDHGDFALGQDGNDIYVTDNAEDTWPDKLRHIERHDLGSGARVDLLGADWRMSRLISGRAYNKPGWAIVSTYGNPALQADSVQVPFEDEIFALKLDGSGEVRRIIQHRSQRFSKGDYSYNNYWDQPNAAVSKSGRYILFTSNWRELNKPEDVYLIDLASFSNW